jgi:hypothetical protein
LSAVVKVTACDSTRGSGVARAASVGVADGMAVLPAEGCPGVVGDEDPLSWQAASPIMKTRNKGNEAKDLYLIFICENPLRSFKSAYHSKSAKLVFYAERW